MPTILTHAAVPLALGLGLGPKLVSRPLLVAGVVASVLPDLDVLAFRLNIHYSDILGHRGFSHAILFALIIAFAAIALSRQLRTSRITAFIFVAISALSHGFLDMFTNGGLGVALWWPWTNERFFAPWQVIEVSPLSLHRVFSERGIAVLQSEFLWVWMPAIVVLISLLGIRRIYSKSPNELI
ncbi:MAG: metal-dependent hydrolase [Methylophilaceae bacterium]